MARFTRQSPAPSVTGGYQAFRPYVRQDFEQRCAYCLLQELWAGGAENFELDHFRPRSLFPALIGDFYNLYYACHPCNQIKSDQWPSGAMEEVGIGFVDLCQEDFAAHFAVRPDGTWTPLTEAAAYTIDRLRLNRPHLVAVRFLITQLLVE
jgi:hypothetical protein